MKQYDQGTWGFKFMFTCDASVIPKALIFALPSAVMAPILNWMYFDVLEQLPWDNSNSVSSVWSGATFVLGFLVVFRSQQAYSRYWEGASLLRQIRGEWLNATSSLVAFCNQSKEKREEVDAYQHLLVRLVSMLHSCALQTIADMDDVTFCRFSDEGIDAESLCFLADLEDKRHRCEVLTQWIQRHICNGLENGLVSIPPPILSRVFQEISHGVVNLSNARKLTEIPFPFPIAQMLQCMLTLYIMLTPIIAGLLMQSKLWASLFCFCAVLSFTGVNYIAMEIESPFGQDRNDLPLDEMQEDMNQSLWILLDRRSQEPPQFVFEKDRHCTYKAVRHSFSLVHGYNGYSQTSDFHKGEKSKSEKKPKRKNDKKRTIFDTHLSTLGTRSTSRLNMENHQGRSLNSMGLAGFMESIRSSAARSSAVSHTSSVTTASQAESVRHSSIVGKIENGSDERNSQLSEERFELSTVSFDFGTTGEPQRGLSPASQGEPEIFHDLPKDEAAPGVGTAFHKIQNMPVTTPRPVTQLLRIPESRGVAQNNGTPRSSMNSNLEQILSRHRGSLTPNADVLDLLRQQQDPASWNTQRHMPQTPKDSAR